MTLNRLPLSYCSNVHPGLTVAEVDAGLTTYTQQVQQRWGQPLAAGLWLAQPVVHELLQSAQMVDEFGERLRDRGLVCYTMNTFPYGNFHSERVKEQVYLPDWTNPLRREYTVACAQLLAKWLPDGEVGSLSTVPLGFKRLSTAKDFHTRCLGELLRCAEDLAALQRTTGRLIRLAIEPEPHCALETTAEAIAFFQQLRQAAPNPEALAAVNNHLGLCYDVCHQSVEFEETGASIARLQEADVPIHKVHLTCAIEARSPLENAAVKQALAQFIEPRYLHQTFAQTDEGRVVSTEDLSAAVLNGEIAAFQNTATWRVHFHVPLSRDRLGPLTTTKPDLIKALAAVRDLPYAPHLEVETYTWSVLPDEEQGTEESRPDLVSGITGELVAAADILATIAKSAAEKPSGKE